jgi:hypothetical protein
LRCEHGELMAQSAAGATPASRHQGTDLDASVAFTGSKWNAY